MKRTVIGLVSVMLVLGLILAGCSDFMSPIGGAPSSRNGFELGHEFTYDRTENGTTVLVNGKLVSTVKFILVDDQGNEVFAYCVNINLPTGPGAKYKLASASSYFQNGEDTRIKAALTYIYNNYGDGDWPEAKLNLLIQATLWRLVHDDLVMGVYGSFNQDMLDIVNFICENIDNLVTDYSTSVTMEGTAIANPDEPFINYGPYNVSENELLKDVEFALSFDNGGAFAVFVDEFGTEIDKVLPGEQFYVRVAGDVTGYFKFTATASTERELWYVSDYYFFEGIEPNTQQLFQPLMQPLLQPLFDSEIEVSFYSCSAEFSVVPPTPALGPSYGSVTATLAGSRDAILAGLNPKNGNPFYNDKKNPDTPFVVPNSNHFVYAPLNRADLAEGVALDMLVGNNFDVVGSAFVKLVDGNLVITIDGEGMFGATAFSKIPAPKNGNIHSQKEADLKKDFGATTGFAHNNVTVLPCPAGDTIYLYIHCDTIRFYQ